MSEMSRILLLCFIHGFKGTDDTFNTFPSELESQVLNDLPGHHVESIVYPKYETKGELAQASQAFLQWLKERVMDVRKKHLDKPWPPEDRRVGVVLVAHSMGGFVAADALLLAVDEQKASSSPSQYLFPPIQGILAFDTPYNGLARSMFVYGAFSNYSKVTNVFNAMTALSAAAPISLSRLSARNAATSAATSSVSAPRGDSRWAIWQALAVRTGTVGAIAAGGVAAFWHREAIMSGLKSIKDMDRTTIAEGYRKGTDSLGQGLAYVNRGNVGKSFAWLSDHFTFVGCLMKPNELSKRLDRLSQLKGGIGIHDFYCSLGENGYWSGGYFVPERTFCAVPDKEHPATNIFSRRVMGEADDEIQAHLSLFRPDKHQAYEGMVKDSSNLVRQWFMNEEAIVDQWTPDEEDIAQKTGVAAEEKQVQEVLEKEAVPDNQAAKEAGIEVTEQSPGAPAAEVDEESPLDIAAAASLVPLPADATGDDDDDVGQGAETLTSSAEPEDVEKQAYLRYLMKIAQRTGTGMRSWVPEQVPSLPEMPKMPQMPQMPSMTGMPSMPSVGSVTSSLPNVSFPGIRKRKAEQEREK